MTMKKFMLLLAGLFLASSAHAATVYLKNGSTVEGNIVEKTGSSVKIDVNGVSVTYYNDEIDRVDDGAAPAAVTSAAGAPAEQGVPLGPDIGKMLVANAPLSEISEAKKDLILKFVDAFGTREAMKMNFEQMAVALPPDKADAFRKAFRIEDIITQLIPVYNKYFSESDLNAFIQFYNSPSGKKLTGSLPMIMQESIGVSMKYFEANMPPELKDAPAAAPAAPAAK
jgi:hypothetical protein